MEGLTHKCFGLMQMCVNIKENYSVILSNLILRRKNMTLKAQCEDFVSLLSMHIVTFKLSEIAIASLDSNTNTCSQK